ncbi:MAG: hypothetical protein QOH61_1227 [Chloroflexota bacterium]|jgi:hypothetical protein|nr:hypothetical protein [Chloroflexota bacterium]
MPKPEFAHEAGPWKEPDFVVRSDRRQDLPKRLPCRDPKDSNPPAYVVYAAEAIWINKDPTRNGCPTEWDWTNVSVVEAWDGAIKAALKIGQKLKCPKECPELVATEIWHGGQCSRVDPPGWDLMIVAVSYAFTCLPK